FFVAAKLQWPIAWSGAGDRSMLNKTNGFKALIRLLRPVYLYVANPGDVVSVESFAEILTRSTLKDEDFTTDRYKPGTSGETALFNELKDQLELSY
ncbi:MAG: hypothetical protein KJZ53_10520, partial [Anaerolineales bacterium]|nr:hypothetical protein [Anaerolineales bacterium]